MSSEIKGGLIVNGQTIPLKGVLINATLSGVCAEVTVTHRYTNEESTDVEAVYVFPLDEGAAVSGFRARIGDRVITGYVEEKERAFEIYDDAMADGHGAFLLDQERPNIFTASVGNLKPKQSVDVEITYVSLLKYEGEAIRFLIPTTISPRFVPEGPTEIGEPDGDRVNPERWPEVPYGLTLNVEVSMDSPIRVIESPSHTVRAEHDGSTASITLSGRETALDRDFVLLVEPRDARKPKARVTREEDGTRVVCVTFSPDDSDFASSGGNEVVFLLDCSGSMRGNSIVEARRALQLCLRALTEDDSFNIYVFGGSFSSLWPSSRPYSEKSLEEAKAFAERIDANMGGTNILAPLEDILRGTSDERPRQLLLMTDGQVSNEAQVIALCERHAATSRVFSFGIGAGVSELLVRETARVSNGAAEFIYPGERIEPKVLRMFGRVNSPAFKETRVDWGDLRVEQAPKICPPVFAGDTITLFARVQGGLANEVTLTADELSWTLPLDLEKAEPGGAAPVLWARLAIRDLETKTGSRGSNQARGGARPSREDRNRERIVELGKRYGLMSSATSYVAVEERPAHEQTTAQAELRRVPIALTHRWGGVQRFARAPMPGRGYAMKAAMKGRTMAMGSSQAPAPSSPMLLGEVQSLSAGASPAFLTPQRKAAETRGASAGSGAASAIDPLFELLLTQKADGSFLLSPVLEQMLGSSLAAVQSAIATDGEAVVITAVVLELLSRRFATRKGEWKPAAKKMKRWIKKARASFDASSVLA
jgi:Ca-activated chloride channel family protein